MADKEMWKKVEIKGVANADKNAFTESQQKFLTNIGGLHINLLASITEKGNRLAKIAKNLKIKFQIE